MEKEILKKELIKYYTKNGKDEFVLRLRGNKYNPEIICYYKGIKVFKFGADFEVNKAVFMPNNTNDIKNIETAKNNIGDINIPQKALNRFENIEKSGFELIVGKYISVRFSNKVSDNMTSEKNKILENNMKIMTKTLEDIGVIVEDWKALYNKQGKKVGIRTEIQNVNNIDYTKFYKMVINKYSCMDKLQAIYESKRHRNVGFKSMELNSKIELKNTDKLMENIDVFNNTMKIAIEKYALKEEIDEQDFMNTREDSEKAYQQNLMLIMNNEDKKKEILGKESPFDKNDIPFEMEYYIYASDISKEQTVTNKREEKNRKGRLDNIIINAENKELKLIEVKIDAGVIGGTNGIHKHLLDLANCIKKNPNLVNEILNHATQRKDILEEAGIDNNYFKIPTNFEKIYYYIVCGYTDEASKKRVENRINEIKYKTILDEDVFFTQDDDKDKNKIYYEAFKNNLNKKSKNKANEYIKELLNKDIAEYCQILKNENIETKIFIADENYKNFKEVLNG